MRQILKIIIVFAGLTLNASPFFESLDKSFEEREITEYYFFKTDFNKGGMPEVWMSNNGMYNGSLLVWDIYTWDGQKYKKIDGHAEARDPAFKQIRGLSQPAVVTYSRGSSWEGTLLAYVLKGDKIEEINLGTILPKDDGEEEFEEIFSVKIKTDTVSSENVRDYLKSLENPQIPFSGMEFARYNLSSGEAEQEALKRELEREFVTSIKKMSSDERRLAMEKWRMSNNIANPSASNENKQQDARTGVAKLSDAYDPVAPSEEEALRLKYKVLMESLKGKPMSERQMQMDSWNNSIEGKRLEDLRRLRSAGILEKRENAN